MAIIHLDGFDQFSNITNSENIVGVLNSSGYEALNGSSSSIVFGEGTEIGTTGLRITQQDTYAVSYVERTVTATNLMVFGFAFKADARHRICTIDGVGNLNWNGRNVEFTTDINPVDGDDDPISSRPEPTWNPSSTSATGTAVPILNTWYYYEIAVDLAANEVRVYINGRLDMTASDFTTEATEYTLRFGWKYDLVNVPNVTQQFDDTYIVTGEGTRLNDVLGPIKVTTRFPTADVTTEWTPSDDEIPHWELVSQRPPRSDYFIQSNESGAIDLFSNQDEFEVDGTILAVGVVARALKTDIDDREIGLVLENNGVQSEVIDPDMETDYKYHYGFFAADPNGNDWTINSVLETNFGVTVRP